MNCGAGSRTATAVMPTRRGGTRVITALIVIAALCVIAAVIWSRHESEPARKPQRTATVLHESANGYVGPEACRECHAARVEEFTSTNHFRTARKPDATDMASRLKTAGTRYQSRDAGCRFEVEQRGDEFFVTAFVANESGDTTREQKRSEAVALVYGAGTADEVFHYRDGDRLFQLPLAYINPDGQWANAPGYHDGSASFLRDTTPRCVECHNTWAEYAAGSGSVYNFKTFIPGVTCERCHGPGADHVAWHRRHPDAADAHAIIQPATLPRERQLDVCSQCHSNSQHRRTAPFSYRPGDELANHFRPDQNALPERSHTASQITSLRQSKCFQLDAAMTCTTCHDPHIPSRPGDSPEIRSCLQCHQPEHCAKREQLPDDVRDRCVDCHMPQRHTMNLWFSNATEDFIPLGHRREHRIGVYPWAAKAVLLDSLRRSGDADSTAAAEQLAAELFEHELARGDELQSQHRLIAAIGAWRDALRWRDDTGVRSKIADAANRLLRLDEMQHTAARQLAQGDYSAAVSTLRTMLEAKPNEAMVHGKLGLALASAGRTEEAIEQLSAVTEFDPDLAYGDALLGWIYYLDNRFDDSARHYQLAIEKTPFEAKLQYQYALTLIRLDEPQAAEQCLRTALEIDPSHQQARQELAAQQRRGNMGQTPLPSPRR